MTEQVLNTSEKASKPAAKKTTRKATAKKSAPKAALTETDIPQADNPITVDKDVEIAELKRRVTRLERMFNVSE